MDYPVKYFHSAMRGAPIVSGTAGSLLAMLDACLATGFGLVAAQAVSVTGGIATATLPLGSSFDEHAIVQIDGATPQELNGNARVLPGASSTQIQFETSAPDGVATGAITIKVAPADWWQKVYAGVNKAVWRSGDQQANGHYLRIDDSGTTYARVRGYESMTDVDTGNGPFPADTQMSGGGYWYKSTAANTTAVRWKLFCDSRAVLLAVAPASTAAAAISAPMRGFGDPLPLHPGGDPWCTFLSSGGSGTASSNGQLECGYASSNASNGMTTAPRAWQGLGGCAQLDAATYCGASSSQSGNDATLGAFPSVIDGRMLLSSVFLRETGTTPPRADVPGVLRIPQTGALALLADGDVVSATGGLQGRRLVAVATVSTALTSAPVGVYLVDATGPWR